MNSLEKNAVKEVIDMMGKVESIGASPETAKMFADEVLKAEYQLRSEDYDFVRNHITEISINFAEAGGKEFYEQFMSNYKEASDQIKIQSKAESNELTHMKSLLKKTLKDLVKKIGASTKNIKEFAEAIAKLQPKYEGDPDIQKYVLDFALEYVENMWGYWIFDQFMSNYKEALEQENNSKSN